MSDSLLQAIISGNPLGLPGLGSNENGVTILFPLSMGNTVTDLANTLHVPVDSILAVNPGMQADTPLTASQVIGLPEGHINQIMRSLNPALDRSYGPSPSPPSQGVPPTTDVTHGGYLDHLLRDGMQAAPPLLRSMPAALDMYNMPRQDEPPGFQGNEEATNRWLVSVASPVLSNVISAPHDLLPGITSVSVLSLTSTSTQASTLVLASAPAPTTAPATVLASVPSTAPQMPTSNIDPRSVTLTASAQNRSAGESTFHFAPVERALMQTEQSRGRSPASNPPPPPLLIDGGRPAVQVTWVVPPRSTEFVPTVATQNTMVLPTDNRPITLQLMALLLAQSDGPAAMSGQPQGFIDPQAIAAMAATMRATKVIDLGAGRSMEFSLIADRMRRIDPIGQEDRVAARRTGDGLEEVRVRSRNADEVEQTDEQREQGRRRRAAIAAMRRRRRLRSRRCRYWRGTRRDLHPSSTVRYPKRVDFAEFQSRQPPRYMWNVDGGER